MNILTRLATFRATHTAPSTAVERWQGPRADCGCPIKAIAYLDGQHPWYCQHPINDVDTRRFSLMHKPATPGAGVRPCDVRNFPVGQLGPHTVDGVPMPCASPGGVDLSHRWCDISELHDGVHVARRFDDTHHLAMAAHLGAGDWMWVLYEVHPDGAEPKQLASGTAEKITAVMQQVYTYETEYELAA